jgi:hypothetical protein
MPTSLNRWRLVQDKPIESWLAQSFNELDEANRLPRVTGATQAVAREKIL